MEHMRNKLEKVGVQVTPRKVPPPSRRQSPRSKGHNDRCASKGSLLEAEVALTPGRTEPPEETISQNEQKSSSGKKTLQQTLPSLQQKEMELVSESRPMTLHEESVPGSIGGAAIVSGGQDLQAEVDEPAVIIKLHLAIEGLTALTPKDAGGKSGCLGVGACAEFCVEWPTDNLPKVFDPSLLRPLWSVVEQVWFSRRGDI